MSYSSSSTGASSSASSCFGFDFLSPFLLTTGSGSGFFSS